MDLIDKIDEKYKNSIKEKDSNSINTLRLVKSAIKDKQILLRAKQDQISDSDILSILQTLIKQRKDSIVAFEKANRKDLIDKEKAEIKIIEVFLPKQKNEEETKIIIEGSDLVLALDLHVLMSLNQEFPSNMKKFKLLNYQNPSINIPDPYRLSDDEYLDVMKRIDTIVSELDINT